MNITSCDREPIHIPGSIQPHGLLLVLDWEREVVKQFAGAPSAFLGVAEPLGLTATELFGASIKSAAPAGISQNEEPVPLPNLMSARRDLQVIAHRRGADLLLEIEAAANTDIAAPSLLHGISRDATAIQRASEIHQVCNVAAKAIARQTGYDRVMIYQFLPDGSGKVVAEHLSSSLGSFLNQHFPASDIPKQARDLYKRNHIRVIPDIAYVPAPLVPPEPEGQNLDMTDCALRSVSPIHIQYLKNMGVAASLSISIMQNGSLWGLIACHHASSRNVSYEAREACKQLSTLLGLQLQHLVASRRADEIAKLAGTRDQLIMLLSTLGVREELPKRLQQVARLISSDGLIFASQGKLETFGTTPAAQQCHDLVSWLNTRKLEKVFTSGHLAKQFAPAGEYVDVGSGILAIFIEDDEPINLIWIRGEYAHEVLWAGNPHKDTGPAGELTPRNSFDGWQQEVRGHSLPWSDVEVEAAHTFRERVGATLARQRTIALQSELIFLSRVSAMGAMAATLAHELNQPLAAISNYASGVMRALEAGEGKQDLIALGVGEIHANAIRAGDIIRSLRKMIRRGEVTRSPQDLEQIVEQALTLVRSGDARCGAAIIDCNFQHEQQVMADPIQIQQVLVNLVRNACDAFAPGGQPRLIVNTTDGAGYVQVEVKDDGPGIPATIMENLFDAFSTMKEDGLGIGLSISRTIVEAHGGKIQASNHPEGGASFTFSIPAEQPEQVK